LDKIVNLVIVPGHAIYQDGFWYGGFGGQEQFYEQHVEDGISISRMLPSSCLCFSGGHTRPNSDEVRTGRVTNSEALGMLQYAHIAAPDIDEGSIILEEFARDAFENIFFALLGYFHKHLSWPNQIHVVTWPFKANRYYLIACGLKLGEGRFVFHGSGDLMDQHALETVCPANVAYESEIVSSGNIVDPLHRSPQFANKRHGRMPIMYSDNEAYMNAVKRAYDPPMPFGGHAHGQVSSAVDTLANVSPGPAWKALNWPWSVHSE
jgi:hypothetical protein